MTQENKTVTIQTEHRFGDNEMAALGRQMASKCQDRQRLEDQLASIRKDFGAKIQAVELDIDLAAQKLRDGFEMRPTLAVVCFNDPSLGRKSFWPANTTGGRIFDGVMISEAQMDATDFQRDLPLEEKPVTGDEWAGDPPSARDPERFPEIGDREKEIAEAKVIVLGAGESIGTSLADKLATAAQGAEIPPVVIDLSDKDGWNKCLAKWRQAARKQEWPEACIDLLNDVAVEASTGETKGAKNRVLDVLRAHSISKEDAEKTREQEIDALADADSRTAGDDANAGFIDADRDDAENLADTFGNSEEK